MSLVQGWKKLDHINFFCFFFFNVGQRRKMIIFLKSHVLNLYTYLHTYLSRSWSMQKRTWKNLLWHKLKSSHQIIVYLHCIIYTYMHDIPYCCLISYTVCINLVSTHSFLGLPVTKITLLSWLEWFLNLCAGSNTCVIFLNRCITWGCSISLVVKQHIIINILWIVCLPLLPAVFSWKSVNISIDIIHFHSRTADVWCEGGSL